MVPDFEQQESEFEKGCFGVGAHGGARKEIYAQRRFAGRLCEGLF